MQWSPQQDAALPVEPRWAPLTFTFAGIWEIQPEALEEHGVNIVLGARVVSWFWGR